MVSGRGTELLRVLAEHADLDALWSFGDDAQSVMAKSLSAGNLKQVFTNEGRAIDWFDAEQGEGKWWLTARGTGEECLGAVRGVESKLETRKLEWTLRSIPPGRLIHEI